MNEAVRNRRRHVHASNVYNTRPAGSEPAIDQPPEALYHFPISFETKRRIVIVIGETDSGKTLFVRLLAYCNRNVFNQIIVFSETAKYESPLRFTEHIVTAYKPELLETVIKIQQARLDVIGGKNPVDKMTTQPIPHILLIFDDLDMDYSQDAVINNLVTRSRHLYISIVFSVQYYSMVSRRMRSLASYICLRTLRGRGNMEELYDLLALFFEDFRQFRDWSIRALQNYTTIVIYLRGESIWDEDVRFVRHKPESIPDFFVGKKSRTIGQKASRSDEIARVLQSSGSG